MNDVVNQEKFEKNWRKLKNSKRMILMMYETSYKICQVLVQLKKNLRFSNVFRRIYYWNKLKSISKKQQRKYNAWKKTFVDEKKSFNQKIKNQEKIYYSANKEKKIEKKWRKLKLKWIDRKTSMIKRLKKVSLKNIQMTSNSNSTKTNASNVKFLMLNDIIIKNKTFDDWIK